MRIERGIKEVQWKTKDGTQVRYRVRIKRKDFEADQLFENLKAARDYLALAKTKDGQLALTEHGQRAKMAEEAMVAYLKSPPLEVYLNQYFLRYLKNDSSPTKIRSSEAHKSRIRTICRTEISTNKKELTGLVAMLKKHAKGNEKKLFGSLKIEDINEEIATDYIVERCRSAKKITVKREAAMLQAFFNKLRYLDNATWKRLSANPFENADKSLLKDATKKRKRRLSEDEEYAIFSELKKCKNPEMLAIVGLALTTGMRRGEILELKWTNLGEKIIQIDDGKSGFREVVLNDESKLILDSIKNSKKDENLFHYTADGFASNWDRVKNRSGVTNFRFHDLRREFISRLVETISNPLAIVEMSTLRDPNHIDRHYLEPLREDAAAEHGIQTEADLLRTVGHKNRATTGAYFTRKS